MAEDPRKRPCQDQAVVPVKSYDQRHELCDNLATIDDIISSTQGAVNNSNFVTQVVQRIASSIKISSKSKLLLLQSNDSHKMRLQLIELEQDGNDESLKHIAQLERHITEGHENAFWNDAMQESERIVNKHVEDMNRKLNAPGNTQMELLNSRSLLLEKRDREVEGLKSEKENLAAEVEHLKSKLAEAEDKKSADDGILCLLHVAKRKIEKFRLLNKEAVDRNQKLSDINGQMTTKLRDRDSQTRAAVERELTLVKKLEEARLYQAEIDTTLTEKNDKIAELELRLEERLSMERFVQRGKI